MSQFQVDGSDTIDGTRKLVGEQQGSVVHSSYEHTTQTRVVCDYAGGKGSSLN